MRNIVPSNRQLEYQDWEMGLFFHFGIRTFYEGHTDWDEQFMSPAEFNPQRLDCGQWIRTGRDAGFRYAILVCKHHDGFANWNSRYTDYSVAKSPWKDGKGDVVREFIDACEKYNMKKGLYYSPAEFGSIKRSPAEYDDYFINQISELLTGYGSIDILWFDGCGSDDHKYNWPRIVAEIRRMQPNILLFNMGDPDIRWCGNEVGLNQYPSLNTAYDEFTGRERWLPMECDARMRQANWFYSGLDAHTVKSLDQLMGLYYHSVGRGANFLLNIGPNRDGLLPEKDRVRLLEFGGRLRDLFSNQICGIADFTVENNRYECCFISPQMIDHVILQECIEKGESIRSFTVSCEISGCDYRVFQLYKGSSVGHKHICRFPPVHASRIIVEINESDEDAELSAISGYYINEHQ